MILEKALLIESCTAGRTVSFLIVEVLILILILISEMLDASPTKVRRLVETAAKILVRDTFAAA